MRPDGYGAAFRKPPAGEPTRPDPSAYTLRQMSQHLEQHELANGMRVVLHEDRRLPLAAINVWYHVGSKNEQTGRTGLAHLFEHMLFQGSANVSVNGHFEHVQKVGGVANGSTWYDRTNYYETLPSNQLELGLWLESDRMGFLLEALTSEKFENQRSVVMNERLQRVDNQPYGKAVERLSALLYRQRDGSDHPYAWPVIGYMEDLEAATLDGVRDFFRTWYRPNNAVLTIAGDIASGAAIELAQRYFEDIEPAPLPAPPAADPAGDVRPRGTSRDVLEDTIELPRSYSAWCLDGYGSDDWYAGEVLASILASGMMSRLQRDLVYQRQIAQSVSAAILPTEICAAFFIVATCQSREPDALANAEQVEQAVNDHLDALRTEGPTGEELERALRGLLLEHHNGKQDLALSADRLSAAATYFDDPSRAWNESERLQRVSAEQVRELAERALSPERRAAVVVVPGA